MSEETTDIFINIELWRTFKTIMEYFVLEPDETIYKMTFTFYKTAILS